MGTINIDRINKLKVYELGERPIELIYPRYKNIKIKDNYLVDSNNKKQGTKGDMYHKYIMDYILKNGCFDNNPRPKYHDFYENAYYDKESECIITKDRGSIKVFPAEEVFETDLGVELISPAHTLSVNNGIECSYDLSKGESPLITLRPIYTKGSIAEMLWIYQKESNDLVEFDKLLDKNTWDEDKKINNWWKDWAITDSDGYYILNEFNHPTIGSCYGESVRKRHMLKKEVIEQLKNNPDGRRNISSLWQVDDFNDPHGLKPCAFLTIWNIRHDWDKKDYLDMTLIQRSSDFLTAGSINQFQYSVLLKMVAKDLGVEAGIFTWKPINVQIYDRHINPAIIMLGRNPINCNPDIKLNEDINNFDDFKMEDIEVINYPIDEIKNKNKQLKLSIGI